MLERKIKIPEKVGANSLLSTRSKANKGFMDLAGIAI
jgi:hypothetical protein